MHTMYFLNLDIRKKTFHIFEIMKWELFTKEDFLKTDSSFLLATTEAFPCIVIQDGEKILPIIEPCTSENTIPALVLTPSEFVEAPIWRKILQYHNIHSLDLAIYSRQHPQIPIEALMEALDLKITYQTREHWQEMSLFAKITRILGKSYGFKINTLRLFDRLENAEQSLWMEIWQKRNIKKNLIRDIIADYYDLSPSAKKKALEMAMEFEEGWGQTSSVFPAFQLRDIVRQLRFPEVTNTRNQVDSVSKKMKFPKQMNLDIPDDFENSNLQLRIQFSSIDELNHCIQHLQKGDVEEGMKNLIELM